jgi:hypothetical protein
MLPALLFMVLMDITVLDHDVAGRRNANHVHVRRWLRSPSSNVIISPSNWVITLIYDHTAAEDLFTGIVDEPN